MELTALKFASDTTELERAAKVIAGLVTDVSKLDKASRDAAKTEEILAKAAKANAEANLANAKAQDQRLKSTIIADKADQAQAAAVEKKTKAIQKETEATSKSTSILQKQKDILEFQTQGYSKGQSGVLAYGKAAGLAAEDITELGKVLETQRKLMGGDPFDKSLSGLKSLQNQYTELKESVRQYNSDSELSSKQTRELARDKERLIEKMKVEGASFSEIRKAVRGHNSEYVALAAQYNKLISAEEAVIKNRKEVVAATNYVTQADQKMAAALNQSNAAIDKAGTDSLVRYENALRKSGVTQEVATAKLAKYRVQLEQVQKQELARREQHLTRALAPQATDVVVSLWSGQNPLTVLLQQGGQVTDLFMQSGIAAEKFGEVVKKSMASMLPSILTVVKGVGGLLVDGFMAAGNAVTGFLGKITFFTAASDQVYKFLASDGPSIAAQRWAKLSGFLSGVLSVGIAAVTAGLIAFGVAAVKAAGEQRELTSALVMQGANLGLTSASAIDLAKSLDIVGVTTSDTVVVITEMAKAGNLGKESIAMITEAAVNLHKWGGVAIADTVKTFSSIGKDPVEATIKFAKETGLLTAEQIKLVDNLVKTEGKAAGVKEAMELMGRAHNDAAQKMKDEAGLLVRVWVGFLDVLGKVKSAIMDVGRSGFTEGDIAKTQALVNATAKQLEGYTIAGGTESGGYKQALIQYKELSAELEKQTRLKEANAKATTTQTEENSKQARSLEYQLKLDDDLDKKLKSLTKQQVTKTEYVNEYIAKLREQGKVEGELYEKAKKVAELEWQKANKGAGKQTQKDLEVEIDILNKRAGLASSYNNELDSLQRLRAKGLITEEEYIRDVEELIKLQPFYVEQQKQINAAHDLSNKLLGKSDTLGKDYYKTLEQIQKFQDEGLYSPEKAEQLRKAAFDQTELAKNQLKYVEESTKTYIKYREESQKSLNASTLENQKLDDRIALLGLTSEQQKYLKIQQQQRNALLQVEQKLTLQIAKIWEDVRQGKLDPFDAMSAQIEAERAAAEERKLINREVAVQYAEDFMAEMQKIKSGITDSIVTALFEGGKAGGKKLREVLVGILRQKVTIVVDAVVNTLLGSVVGSLFGGGSGSGGSGGNILGAISNGFSALNGGIANSISNSFASFAMSSTGQSLGLSSMTADGMGPPALTSMGSSLGTAAGMVGSGLAGYGISSAISGGYTTGGNTVNVIAGIASAFLGPIAGVIGGLINRAFGRKLTDTGIQGTFGGEKGFEGEAYKFYKGGWLRSDKTKTSELDQGITKMLSTAFKTMQVQVGTFATVLGLNADKLKDFTTSVKISLHGLQGAQIDQAIQEALATANNELAQQVIGTWETTQVKVKKVVRATADEVLAGGAMYKEVEETLTESTYKASEYAKEGEKAIDTLTRLATSLGTVNGIFDTLGYTLYESSLAGGDMASKLADLFGGLDKLVSATTAYYQNFYSEEERQATALRQLTAEFKKHNLTIPKTRDEYRKMVEAQDLTTEEGRKMYAWLIQMAPVFAEISESAENATDKLRSSVESAFSVLEGVIQREINLLEKQADAVQKNVDRLRAVFDLLTRNIRELYQQTEPTSAMLAAQGRQVIDTARSTGVIPDISLLSDSISAVRSEIESANYTTQFEADKARLQFAAELTDLQKITGEQLSAEELMLKALKDQIEYLNLILANAKLQVDAILGVQSSVLTVTEALDRLHKALFPPVPEPEQTPKPPSFSSGPSGPSGGSTAVTYDKSGDISSYLNEHYQGTSDLRDIAITASIKGWTQADIAAATGYSVADIESLFSNNGISKFANGGVFTNSVVQQPTMFNNSIMGEAGPEAIMPLTNIGGRLGVAAVSSGDSSLAERVGNLEFALQAIAVNTGKMARILDGAQGEDGRSIMTSTAPA